MLTVEQAVIAYRRALTLAVDEESIEHDRALEAALGDIFDAALAAYPDTLERGGGVDGHARAGGTARRARRPAADPQPGDSASVEREGAQASSSPARPAPPPRARGTPRPKVFPQPGALPDLVLSALRADNPERWWQTGELREAVKALPDVGREAPGAAINVALAALLEHELVERRPHETRANGWRWHATAPASALEPATT